jgi:hypothetical protein
VLAGIAAATPFASAGTITLDGSGNVVASSSAQGGTTTVVGSYVLNPDCTITMKLTDVFGTNTTATSLQGIVLNNGAEIDLGVVQSVTSGTGTSGTGTSGTGTSGSGTSGSGTSGSGTSTSTGGLPQSTLLIKLVRPLTATCTTGSLTGSYVLIGTGTSAASSASGASSFFLFASVDFNGAGTIVAPSVAPSSLSSLQFTGTYTVNPDCTGTMTISNAPASSSSSATGSSSTSSSKLSLSFTLTQPSVLFNPGTPTATARSFGPGIEFSQSSSSGTLFGYGVAQ